MAKRGSSKRRWWLAGALLAGAFARCTSCYGGGDLDGRWAAAIELEKYDFLHEAVFDESGRGIVAWGSGQSVKYEARFRHAIEGSTVTLTFEGDERGEVRALRYDVRAGSWTFRMETPTGPDTTHCRLRLTFSESPFPRGEGDRVFHADCEVG
jgi:hypothetical protein